MNNQLSQQPTQVRWRTWVVLLIVTSTATAVGWWQWSRAQHDALFSAAEAALERNDPNEALRLGRIAVARQPDSSKAWLIVCRALLQAKEYTEAVAALAHIPLVDSEPVIQAYREAALATAYQLNRPSVAEAAFRHLLHVSPNDSESVAAMATLQTTSARRWEAIPYLVDLIRFKKIHVNDLALLATEGAVNSALEMGKQWRMAQPVDPVGHLVAARQAIDAGQDDEAIVELRSALRQNPQLVEAHALLGKLLIQQGEFDALHTWQTQLPRMADAHPDIWIVRAQWAQRCKEKKGAVRCYAEALKRNPNLLDANLQMGQLLHKLDEPSHAAPFLKRSQQLRELAIRESDLSKSKYTSLASMQRLADQLVVLGRAWEAWGWSQLALQIDANAAWPMEMQAELSPALKTNPPWTLEGANPVYKFAIDDYPLPRWRTLVVPATGDEQSAASTIPGDVSIRFDESAVGAGLNFQYFNGGDPTTPGQYMYEFTGGGVAVLDFDGDHWPDVYLTQGCRWPPDDKQTEHLDQFFRNGEGKHFQNVTLESTIVENQFSQGVTTGDVNNDGFPDLFVANIGHNRLLINNGDGTFEEARLPGDQGRWTTSCAIADLNGDTWPDLYATNYLAGDDVFTRICAQEDGVHRMCLPHDFAGSPDEFYLNLGDGRFVDASHLAGFHDVENDGKGLGIVVADFSGGGRLDLFVANDLVENFFFVNKTTARGDSPYFQESAVTLGLAHGVEGTAQACMGIAAGDADGDQHLDLFVTNFLMEPNAFYRHQSGGVYSDDIHKSGLYDVSMQQLGFGTQFIDGDLDGRLDLIVTNGHIEDLRNEGRAYRMPPQFFYNIGSGAFREVDPELLGEFFTGTYLGRSVARCDWNRDGAEDAIIAHLDSPAALLTNTTPNCGHFVSIHIRGTASDRDAIGTTVRMEVSGQTFVRQLTAGDGYQASNERMIHFGLGESVTIDNLEVRWPTGNVESFTNVPVDRRILFIEGMNELIWFRY